MKNKGFTLMELLGVIVIISLLLIIVFPNITNSVKNSSKKTDKLTEDLIFNASDMYISNHSNLFTQVEGKKFEITLKDLVDDSLLVSPIKYEEDDDITKLKCVEVTYTNNKYHYELKNSGECEKIVCKATNIQKDGEYHQGDEYECYVSTSETINFYILTEPASDSSNIDFITTQKLIADSSENSLVKWGTVSNGPTLALNQLKNLTKNWSNIKSQNITTYKDSNNNDVQLSSPYNGIKARLPYPAEITNNKFYSSDGYWTMAAKYVSSSGVADATISTDEMNIRAVINVPKSNVWNYVDAAPGELPAPPRLYGNGEIVYFDVVNGRGCSQEQYEKSKRASFMTANNPTGDFTNSATGYYGTGGATYTTCDSNGNGCQNYCLKFYAFGDKTNNATLNLLADHNISGNVKWYSSSKTNLGPCSDEDCVLGALKSKTDRWKGTLPQQNYVDPTYEYTIQYNTDSYKYKARLITYQEVLDIAVGSYSLWSSWLFDRLRSNREYIIGSNISDAYQSSYWTSSAYKTISGNVWVIGGSGFTYCTKDGCIGNDPANDYDSYGVRPVITVNKCKLTDDYNKSWCLPK